MLRNAPRFFEVAKRIIEITDNCLIVAHNADFEDIQDTKIRAPLEARNLMMGRELVLQRGAMKSVDQLVDLVIRYNSEVYL